MHEEATREEGGPKTPRKAAASARIHDPESWPAIKATMAAWTVDGDPAARPTLTLFWSGATCVKAVITDRRTGMQLWATATRLAGLLDALDVLLSGPEVPWEVGARQGEEKAFLRLLKAHTSRRHRLELE
jgi:hypothetical protein